MASFLQKLKSGGVAVDNNAPPDSSGTITRRIEKRFAAQPASSLGLTVGNDAEVLAVEQGSAAAAANIPVGYMIFSVNNEFVETNTQFEEAAQRSLNLVVKLQSLASMAELIARILREEESLSVEEARKKIKLDELARTTPRYNFLASDHPLFRRYTNRLRSRREATALMRQREREAEERMQRENRERIQRELEAAQAEARRAEERAKREEEERRAAQAASPPPLHTAVEQSFIPVFEDKSTFGKPDASPEETPDEKANEEATKSGSVHGDTPAQATSDSPFDAPVSTTELLALLGKPTDIPEVTDALPGANPPTEPPRAGGGLLGDVTEVRYVILPSEEYTLKTGEKIIASLRSRTGPLPAPPAGKPPKISREAREAMKRLAEMRDQEHSGSEDGDSSSSSEVPPKRVIVTDDRRTREQDRDHRHRHHSRSSHSGHKRNRDGEKNHERDRERERGREDERDRRHDREERRHHHQDHHNHHHSSRSKRDRSRRDDDDKHRHHRHRDYDRDRDRDRTGRRHDDSRKSHRHHSTRSHR